MWLWFALGSAVFAALRPKIARGEMVRYMASGAVVRPEEIKAFDWSGYYFREELSSEEEYVFTREKVPGNR